MARMQQRITLPDGVRQPWAECFLLCDFARTENGKLYIVGGGWSTIVPRQLPLDYDAYLAIKLSLPWETVPDSIMIRVDLLDEQGRVLGDAVFSTTLQGDGEPLTEPAGAANETTVVRSGKKSRSLTPNASSGPRLVTVSV